MPEPHELLATYPQAPESVLIETTWTELLEPSGIFDGDKELSNYEATELIARALGAYAVYPNGNGKLSPEASRHNSQVTRTREGEYLTAVIAKFPPTSTN